MSANGADKGGKVNLAYVVNENEYETNHNFGDANKKNNENNNNNNNNENNLKDGDFDVPSQLLFDAIGSLENQSKRSNSSSSSSSSSSGVFFEDGKRRVDYILVHEFAKDVEEGKQEVDKDEDEDERTIRRRFYEEELTRNGLELEEAESTELGVRFVKVHAPWEVSIAVLCLEASQPVA